MVQVDAGGGQFKEFALITAAQRAQGYSAGTVPPIGSGRLARRLCLGSVVLDHKWNGIERPSIIAPNRSASPADAGDHVTVHSSQVRIRPASRVDPSTVGDLAGELAQSFAFSRTKFDLSYPALLAAEHACLLLAAEGGHGLGYLLGFRHLTFYANGPVAWVEEILVRREHRGAASAAP